MEKISCYATQEIGKSSDTNSLKVMPVLITLFGTNTLRTERNTSMHLNYFSYFAGRLTSTLDSLSRVWGNLQVAHPVYCGARFLGDKGGAIRPSYPTTTPNKY